MSEISVPYHREDAQDEYYEPGDVYILDLDGFQQHGPYGGQAEHDGDYDAAANQPGQQVAYGADLGG